VATAQKNKKNQRPKSKKRDASFAAAMSKDPNMGFSPTYGDKKRPGRK